MAQINAEVNELFLREFRDVIYVRKGLKKGDVKETIENAILDYIAKYAKSDSSRQFAMRVKAERSVSRK